MGQYFADVHASAGSQLGHEKQFWEDTPQTGDLGYEELLLFAKKLNWQLRYREAAQIYSMAIALNPKDIRGYRQRAGKYLSTLQPKLARKDLERCRELGGDEMDLSYRLGLCYYLEADYAKAIEAFETCYPLCDDEMGIAVLFWDTLSCWRSEKPAALLQKEYHTGMKVGHHTAYEFVMASVYADLEMPQIQQRLESEESDLEFSIMAYGISCYLAHRGMMGQSQNLRSELLKRDGFWISYAYIAAWNDAHKGETFVEES